MRFVACELRPGTVVSVEDRYGTIKATSPGLFSIEDDPELLPPITPFVQINENGFSSVKVDDPVWILYDKSNSQFLQYIRIVQLSPDIRDLLDSENSDNIEILFSRDTDNGLYQIFFSDGTGIKFLKDESYILITPNGDIEISKNDEMNRCISISADSICIGKGVDDASKVNDYVAKGNEVEDCLSTINNILTKLQSLCSGNPYTMNLSPAFTELPSLTTKINRVSSKDVKIV